MFEGREKITDAQEREEVERLNALLKERGAAASQSPPPSYWSAMLVQVNQRIDHLSSGKAISISWAARVAIPGVVAIISFFVGLHYYRQPEQVESDGTLTAVIQSLSADDLDALLMDDALPIDPASDVLDIASYDVSDYFITSAGEATLVESLTESELNDLMLALGSQRN